MSRLWQYDRPIAITGRHMGIVRNAALVLVVVFAASMFGILTRPLGYLAAIWPANAILLGLFVTRPTLARPAGWFAAFAGFMVAGIVNGDTTTTNLWLTVANLAGVALGFALFQRLDAQDRSLCRPLSMLHLLAIAASASASAAIVGCGLGPLLFNRPISTGFAFWFISELSNYVITLPVLLTARMPARGDSGFLPAIQWKEGYKLLPLAALAISVSASILIGGPGAIAFPVPALLWCSLTYTLAPMSVIVPLPCARISPFAHRLGRPAETFTWDAWHHISNGAACGP